MDTTAKVVVSALAGLAIGAIAGILLAPEKGKTTRKQIISKGDDYLHDLKVKFDEFTNSITEKFESTQKDAEKLAVKGKHALENVKEATK
ncbi:MAG: YtxH domain-containing protein [Schleiferiaceae bacterium]|nr:YtxH domain-containing protein [Schleiferiaceae bacterium]